MAQEQELLSQGQGREPQTLKEHKLHKAVTQIIADLLADLSTFENISNFALSVDLTPKRQKKFFESREALFVWKAAYTTMVKIIDPKNTEGRTVTELEDIVIRTMAENRDGKETLEASLEGRKTATYRYWDVAKEMIYQGIDYSPVSVANYFGIYESYLQGFKASYDVLRLAMDEVCESLSRRYFPIYDVEHYKPYFMDHVMEIRKGDQNAPIDEKLVLRLCVFASYNHIERDQKLERAITLDKIFELASKVLAYGWLMDNWYPEYRSSWKARHREYDSMISSVREELSQNFFSDVYTYSRMNLVISPLKFWNSPFQVMETDAWISGELSGKIELKPFTELKPFMPDPEVGSISAVFGPRGAHKSTILANMIALSVLRKNHFCFLPLSDNSNWPTYAFMPQMPVPKNKAFRFLRKRMKVKPQGIPVLILNVVRDISELKQKGEVLTKYDRILKVKEPHSFRFDFEKVLDELGAIAEEFGYKGNTGLIAMRNLRRKGTRLESTKRFDIDIMAATNALDSFDDWRGNHTGSPCRLSFDEIKEVEMGQAKSREQSQLGDLIESGGDSARRHNFSMDFVGHLPADVSPRIRQFSVNIFWRNLPFDRSEAKSPVENLLGSLSVEEEAEREAVMLFASNQKFANSGLFWWFNKTDMAIRPIYPMVPPFQGQVVGRDPIDIYNFYLKSNPQIEKEKFLRRYSDLKYDWVASSVDNVAKENEEGEEEEEEKTGPKALTPWS